MGYDTSLKQSVIGLSGIVLNIIFFVSVKVFHYLYPSDIFNK